jgi:uncharacterized protein
MLLPRTDLIERVKRGLARSPAVVLLGPRQCGKSTLARQIAAKAPGFYFDLENPADLRALENPMVALSPLRGLVVIDEVQRRPELFPVLRVLLDRRPIRARFLILGSAAPELLRQTSESLAGRISLIEMSGLALEEVGAASWSRLWLRGGFPASYLARSVNGSASWREDFISTFLERDLPQLGVRVPAMTMRRLWTMVAHYSGGIWNGSAVGGSLGESHTSVRRHLDALSSALVVRVLQPWFENLSKRQVKSPKVYVRDSGLLHSLLGVANQRDLLSHPKLGASWEGFVIEQILARRQRADAYFWRTSAGAELDLLVVSKGRRYGVEIKYADAPALTPSMVIASEALKLHRLLVVYPGERTYVLKQNVTVMSLANAISELT